MSSRSLNINIKGKTWKVTFLTDKTFIKKHQDENCEAITTSHIREIDFKEGIFSRATALHEVFHAFMAECLTGSASLDPHQVEELAAEIVGEHVDDMINAANKIVDHYLVMKHSKPKDV